MSQKTVFTMNSSTKLDSAVFQLTPTRTRFDLVIIVNGKKEKIASGLLHPFLSHLKVAQDQITKGGYSIVLSHDRGNDATWFTKGTVERFVRFVSTPEVLERVYTLESEILQIDEAITIQGNNSLGISAVDENQIKQVESTEGRKTHKNANEEKAVVLYKSDAQTPQVNGSTTPEENSKVQLLKVLEMRKSVLQKEQGMAFARAVAAGFHIDCIPALMSFAECFEASRLMDACRKFMTLWKRKHESGQWLEIEAAEGMPNHIDFSSINASGIILSNTATTSHTELESGSNGKTNSDVFSVNQQPTAGLQDNYQGQFPHHGFPPWPVHSPPGALPAFHPYPVQGIPYYQTYPGNNSFTQPVFSSMEDPRLNAGKNMGHKRCSLDSGSYNTESEALDVESSKSRCQDEVIMEREGSKTGELRKKASRSGRRKSGLVVIRNVNYISKTECTTGSGSYSDSASETDEDTQDSVKTTKRRGTCKEFSKKLNLSDKNEADYGKDAEGGHWQAFQNCLLRGVDEDRHAIDQDQFELEKDHVRRKKQATVNDPLNFSEQDVHEIQVGSATDMYSISNGLTRMPKASNDHLLLSRRAGPSCNGRSVDDVQYLETAGRRNGFRRAANDDFIILKQESESGNTNPSSDMEAVNRQGYSNNKLERRLFHNMSDDSYTVEHRSVRVNGAENTERDAIDMDSEFPKLHKKEGELSYQPNELRLMPERGTEKGPMRYDRALHYEMQAQAGGGASQNKNKVVLAQTKPGSKMLNKEQRSKLTPNNSDKKKTVGPIRREKMNKPSPLDDARARAERLRNYKADLLKMRKEKEEEEKKRIEALKMERQRRIAARSSSVTTKSLLPSQVTNKRLPTKKFPNPHKGLKFSDSEPRSSSPFQRFPMRTAFVGSSGPSKASTTSRSSTGSHSATNKLSRSVPSLHKSKVEMDDRRTDTKASTARIRRLSEPKMSTIRRTPPVEARSSGTRTVSKSKVADETENRRISAIVNHDKSKTATLPGLKIRISNAGDIVQNRSSKEKTQKLHGFKSSTNSAGTLLKKNEIQTTTNNDGDDNPIIEKTVVMLECAKPCAPDINKHKSEKKPGIPKSQYENDGVMDKTETLSSYVAVCAAISPIRVDAVDIETSENQALLQPKSSKVKVNTTEKEPSISSSICIAEETYHAPYARVSSLEDCCSQNSEYDKAPPSIMETSSIVMETFRARMSDSRNSTLEKIPEVIERPQAKESSKGLRRLLKFGRKNHGSPTTGCDIEPDNGSIDGSEANNIGTNGSTNNEVHTLKNLISRDETPSTSATAQKSSRTFSLLSPFRSKNSEKKIMMA